MQEYKRIVTHFRANGEIFEYKSKDSFNKEEVNKAIEHCDWLGIDPFGVEFKEMTWE